MEELLNEKVRHVKFGVGVIASIIGEEKIIVKFENLSENKKFQCPDAFECLLEFENSILQESILKQLKDKKERVAIEKEKIRQEHERQYEERRKEELELAKNKRKTAKTKSKKLS